MLGEGETNLFVGDIEVSVVLLDEGITKDDGVSETGGELDALDTEDALALSLNSLLDDVELGLKGEVFSSDDDVDGGEAGDGVAVNDLLGVSGGLGDNLDDGGGSNNQRSSGIDDTSQVGDVNALSGDLDVV